MANFITEVADATIPNAGTLSNIVGPFDDANNVIIYSPAALTGTVNIQVAPRQAATPDTPPAASTFFDLKSAGANITVGVTAAVMVTDVAFTWLQLKSSVGEGAARTFNVRKQFRN